MECEVTFSLVDSFWVYFYVKSRLTFDYYLVDGKFYFDSIFGVILHRCMGSSILLVNSFWVCIYVVRVNQAFEVLGRVYYEVDVKYILKTYLELSCVDVIMSMRLLREE